MKVIGALEGKSGKLDKKRLGEIIEAWLKKTGELKQNLEDFVNVLLRDGDQNEPAVQSLQKGIFNFIRDMEKFQGELSVAKTWSRTEQDEEEHSHVRFEKGDRV